MPSEYYNRNFRPQYYYHIFNRGAYKHKIFKDTQDYETFIEILIYYLTYPTAKHFSYKKLVNKPYIKVPNLYVDSVRLISYCLHFILKQTPSADKKTNISNLMRRTMITYSMHFHYKYKHSGSLFESKFKNVIVDTKEQLLHLSKYIHKHQTNYSSLPIYLKETEPVNWLYPEYVLKLTKNYYQFFKSPTKKTHTEKLTLE